MKYLSFQKGKTIPALALERAHYRSTAILKPGALLSFFIVLFFVNNAVAQRNNTASKKTVAGISDQQATDPGFYKNWVARVSNIKGAVASPINENENDYGEDSRVAHNLPFSGGCFPGTVNRFSGSYHSNLYIGNNGGVNQLVGWGQNMGTYTGTAPANDSAPVTITGYAGVPLEVRSSSSGGAAGLSALLLRTTTNVYAFGSAANFTAITSMAGFGGATLTTAASDVTAKLPGGVSAANITQMAISEKGMAIITTTGDVYMLTTAASLQGSGYGSTSVTSNTVATGSKTFVMGTGLPCAVGDSINFISGANIMKGTVTAYTTGTGSVTATIGTISGSGTFASWTVEGTAISASVWHHVSLANGTTNLTAVTNFCLSSSGAFAYVRSTNKLYYWGAPANVAGVANTTTHDYYAFDMSAQIPSGKTIHDLVVLGTLAPSPSTLFILCNDGKVYASGLNTNGALGINSATYTTNQATFQPVIDTLGLAAPLAHIAKIDGDTEADIFSMGAMDSTGVIYGWGDGPAGMLGVPLSGATVSSYPVPKTVRMFNGGGAPGSGYRDFSIVGHFSIAFYYNAGTSTDQYWYLGHNIGGSLGIKANQTTFIVENAPVNLAAPLGISFDCSVLPLQMLSFTGRVAAGNVLLNWSTATEQNTRDFLVQHSTNSIDWQTIGTVTAAYYSSSTENYNYTDTKAAKGINYYRLILRDMDGNFTYSIIVSVLIKGSQPSLIIYPNPVVNGKLNVQVDQPGTLCLYNSIGMLMMTKQLQAGNQQLDVSNLATGIYQLKVGAETVKFLIQ